MLTFAFCLAALAATGWVLLVGLGAAPGVSRAETVFAVRSFAVSRFGFSAARLPWYDGGTAALQVAAYENVSGALGRSATVVVAAREAMVAAALLTGVSLAFAARRLKLSGPATVAALLLLGLPPAAVLLHRTAEPTNLAVLWACSAVALAGGSRRRVAVAGSACLLALAVVTAPVVLVALVPLCTYLLCSRDAGRLRGPATWLVGIAGLLAWAGLVLLTRRGDLPGVTEGAPLPPLTPLDVGLLVAVATATLAALAVRRLRALVAALLGIGVAAVLATDARLPLVLVAVPVAALLLPAVCDAAAGQWARWWTERSRHAALASGRAVRAAPTIAIALVAAAVVAAWVPASTAARGPGTDVPAAMARDWVLAGLPSRPRLAVDETLWAELVQAGYPPGRLAAIGGLGPGGQDWPNGWADATFVAGRDRALLGAPANDIARRAREHSAQVAGFGEGVNRVQIRRVLTDLQGTARQAVQDTRSRAGAGTALARNPRLRLSRDAVALLRRGDVDARVQTVLAGIAADHTLAIGTFPAVTGEDDRLPRRMVAVTAIDGQQVTPGASAVTQLGQWLQAQQPPYRPGWVAMAQASGRTAFLVRYDALRQTGLLPI